MSTIIDSPVEASRFFNRYMESKINHMVLFNALPDNKKQMIFTLVTDMLPDDNLANCGEYFKLLLKQHNMTYTALANYILGYIECIEENPEDKAISQIKSSLQSLEKAKSFDEDNYIIKYVCDFFSISTDVLLYGYGKKYEVIWEKVQEVFDKQELTKQEFLDGIFYKVDEAAKKYQKDCDYYINSSHKVFADILEDTYFAEGLLLESEISLLDENAFDTYFNLLSPYEQCAVYHLMENIQKELNN